MHALNGPNGSSSSDCSIQPSNPCSGAELKNYSFLTSFRKSVPFISPRLAYVGPRKQAEDKIGINMVRDERRRKKTSSVTLTELGKYRAVSQSAGKPFPTTA